MTKKCVWVDEIYQGIVRTSFRLKRKLFKGKSAFQTVEVVETEGHGKLLLIDGMTMVSERDEFVYHEMISHPALFLHSEAAPRARHRRRRWRHRTRVLRHKSVEGCVLVEIDGLVVEASRKYIPKPRGLVRQTRPRPH